MQYDEFLGKLQGVESRAGGHVALCPAHDDRTASLSLSPARDRILIYCHAGCAADDVTEALGLWLGDLYYEEPVYYNKIESQPIAIYDYVDESGILLYQVLRFPNKRFSQRHLENGEWAWNMKGVRKVLYKLPDLMDWGNAPQFPVYVVGGEKDVDNIYDLSLELAATTNVGGEGKWLASYPKYFKDRYVIIVADKDEAGMNHAKMVAGSLWHPDSRARIAQSVKIVQAKEGKDVTDHLEAGYSLDELVEVKV